MARTLKVPIRLTSDLDVLSVQYYDCNGRNHTAEDIKFSRTIL